MYDKYQITTVSEAAQLWQLDESTLRRAILDKRLVAQKSAATWLVSTRDVAALYGEPKPETNHGTTGETFFIQNEDIPLVDIGRVPVYIGRHVLRCPDGSIIIIGGYFLRRHGEQWQDILCRDS